MKFFVVALLLASAPCADALSLIRDTHLRSSSNSTSTLKYTMAQHLMKNPVLTQVEYELSFRKTEVVVDKIVLGAIVGLGGSMWGCDRCLMKQMLLGVLKGFTCGGCCIWGCIDFVLVAWNLLIMAPDIDIMFMKATFKPGTVTNGCYVFLAVYIGHALLQTFNRPKHPQAEVTSGLRRNVSAKLAGPPSKSEVMAIFSKYDKDGNGSLDANEVKEALKYLGVPEESWDNAIKLVDKNGDGVIDIAEFASAFDEGVLNMDAAKADAEAEELVEEIVAVIAAETTEEQKVEEKNEQNPQSA